MGRVHYLSLAIAKHVFEHPQHGIVFVYSPLPLAAAKRYGLTPLILYSVDIAGTPIAWHGYSSIIRPRSFSSVLNEAWDGDQGLRGHCDELRVSRFVARASPQLEGVLAHAGIKMTVVPGADQRFAAAIRSAQARAVSLGRTAPAIDVPWDVAQLNKHAEAENRKDILNGFWWFQSKARSEATAQFLTWPVRTLAPSLEESGTWAQGVWMSSWEKNLPPPAAYYFETHKAVWLLQGSRQAPDPDVDEVEPELEDPLSQQVVDRASEKVKLMLDAWPNSYSRVAKAVGIPEKALRWYVSEKCPLDSGIEIALITILGVQWTEHGYEAVGHCCLAPESRRAAQHAYDELSHGGDLEFSVEVVPFTGPSDASFRYVAFRSCYGRLNLMMVARGSNVEEDLDRGRFINFSGKATIPRAVFQDVKVACGKACLAPECNTVEIHNLETLHSEEWDAIGEL